MSSAKAGSASTGADAYAATVGLDARRLPRHVAIIMDGNGRWALTHAWDRTRGHQAGADVVRAITTESVKLGIARLTLYAFSSENWSRPQPEIDFLMDLLVRFLQNELPTLMENGVRLEAIGALERLPALVQSALRSCCATTAGNTNMVLCLALSYGGRDELVEACRGIADKVAAGQLRITEISTQSVQDHLYAPQAADVDVVIRTAGEMRLSNFLIWQATYAEYISVKVPWPDFSLAEYHAALREFQSRERRFGGL